MSNITYDKVQLGRLEKLNKEWNVSILGKGMIQKITNRLYNAAVILTLKRAASGVKERPNCLKAMQREKWKDAVPEEGTFDVNLPWTSASCLVAYSMEVAGSIAPYSS